MQKPHCGWRLKVFALGDPELGGAVVVGEDVAVVVEVEDLRVDGPAARELPGKTAADLLVVAQQPDPAFRKIECRVIGRREQLIFGRVACIGLSYVGG